ncbi:sugar kinase [Arenibacter certesii]|uniref:2-dehydro-3-deoxygluconokinase n=1 Tax=Arenibacter certesii TaxID=228955 RepID=A0A918INW3_9FLAO|nr:sugar kinase [Arenibacter certesii]GGW22198.1 2-dehydro-3-deoxygluconokinase [Arenibacter certesii]
MKKIVTFGEILLRLSTERHLRFSQATNFNATYGGGEFNVAVSLANFGMETEFVTRLPRNDIGDCALQEIRKYKVGTDHIKFGGDRLGIYFLETGAGVRGSKVVYDRENSAIATIELGSIDWKTVFADAKWFHWSGVTPALSSNAAAVCLEAVKAAHELGLTISSDLNYRSKLWKYGKEPKDIMPPLLQYSHILLGDLDTAFFMTGQEKKDPNYQDTVSLPKIYDQLFNSFPNLKFAATTLRYSISASHQKIGGILYDGTSIYNAETREVTPVIDRVGSGDAFMGGLIYSLIKNPQEKQEAIDFATAACCLKHTISGDYNLATIEEITQLAAGNTSGKVSR